MNITSTVSFYQRRLRSRTQTTRGLSQNTGRECLAEWISEKFLVRQVDTVDLNIVDRDRRVRLKTDSRRSRHDIVLIHAVAADPQASNQAKILIKRCGSGEKDNAVLIEYRGNVRGTVKIAFRIKAGIPQNRLKLGGSGWLTGIFRREVMDPGII